MNFDGIDHGSTFDFGKTAEEYAKYRDIYPREMYEKLHALGVAKADENYLDIGTGTGILPKNLHTFGAKITGIDISREQIEAAKRIAAYNKMNIEYYVCPAEKTSFADNSFDSITATQCFWYFDREKIISEIRRIIKPGGVFAKIYMTYMLEDEISRKSHELVLKMNPSWTPAASGSSDMFNHPFANPQMEIFESEIPFTLKSWHGRMCACRGTMASMDNKTLDEWSRKHLQMLNEYPDKFTVKHKIYIAAYRITK